MQTHTWIQPGTVHLSDTEMEVIIVHQIFLYDACLAQTNLFFYIFVDIVWSPSCIVIYTYSYNNYHRSKEPESWETNISPNACSLDLGAIKRVPEYKNSK